MVSRVEEEFEKLYKKYELENPIDDKDLQEEFQKLYRDSVIDNKMTDKEIEDAFTTLVKDTTNNNNQHHSETISKLRSSDNKDFDIKDFSVFEDSESSSCDWTNITPLISNSNSSSSSSSKSTSNLNISSNDNINASTDSNKLRLPVDDITLPKLTCSNITTYISSVKCIARSVGLQDYHLNLLSSQLGNSIDKYNTEILRLKILQSLDFEDGIIMQNQLNNPSITLNNILDNLYKRYTTNLSNPIEFYNILLSNDFKLGINMNKDQLINFFKKVDSIFSILENELNQIISDSMKIDLFGYSWISNDFNLLKVRELYLNEVKENKCKLSYEEFCNRIKMKIRDSNSDTESEAYLKTKLKLNYYNWVSKGNDKSKEKVNDSNNDFINNPINNPVNDSLKKENSHSNFFEIKKDKNLNNLELDGKREEFRSRKFTYFPSHRYSSTSISTIK